MARRRGGLPVTRTMPAPAVMKAETRHLAELLALGLLRKRDIEQSLARMRAALIAALNEAEGQRP